MTGCEEFPVGNLVNWEETNWFLNSSKGTAREDWPSVDDDDNAGQEKRTIVTMDISTSHIPNNFAL